MLLLPHAEALDLRFASAEEARTLLAEPDAFLTSLSPFDRAARLKTDQAVTLEEFTKFVQQQALDWPEAEQQAVKRAWDELREPLAGYAGLWPEKITFILTTGLEEGGAAYTRGSAIILPRSKVAKLSRASAKLICHELFHILSRKNEALKNRAYAVIGFENCGEIPFPPALVNRKITNPDAPQNRHVIYVKNRGEKVAVSPMLFSFTETYDLTKGGTFFQDLQVKLVAVKPGSAGVSTTVVEREGKPWMMGFDEVEGFYEQIGKNTGYIVHPEEVMADNFTMLMLNPGSATSPEILEKLKAVLDAEVQVGKAGN